MNASFHLQLPLVLAACWACACGAATRDEHPGEGSGTVERPPARLLSVNPPSGATCHVGPIGALSCYALTSYQFPTQVVASSQSAPSLQGVVSLSGRNRLSCAAVSDGAVTCWVAGVPSEIEPALDPLASLPETVSVTAGSDYNCALTRDGAVYCWGQQPGMDPLVDGSVPLQIPGLGRAVSVSAGGGHTCALRRDGAVACWGDNGRHQLGVADVTESATPIVLEREAIAIDVGLNTTCIVRPDHTVACWGANFDSQAYTADETAVAQTEDAVDVVVGRGHACALSDIGVVSCWGNGNLAQLGDGSMQIRKDAEPVPNLDRALSIVAGGDITCVQLVSGEHWCWGGYAPAFDPGLAQGS